MPAEQSALVQAVQLVVSEDMSLEEILDAIQADFDDTISYLELQLDLIMPQIESSYNDYVANADLVDDWYALAKQESNALFERLSYGTYVYFKSVVAHYDPTTQENEIDRARDDFYDAIYDDAFDDYYDRIYDDAFDVLYDDVYGGALDDQPDDVAYKTWSKERSAFYKAWSRSHTKIYKAWSRNHTEVYRDWSDVGSAFWKDSYDIDDALGVRTYSNQSIVRAVEQGEQDEQGSAQDEQDEPVTTQDVAVDVVETGEPLSGEELTPDGLHPDFKNAVDSYVAFYDECLEVAQEYANNPDDVTLLMKYFELLSSACTALDALDAWDGEMNEADTVYFIAALADVSQKANEATSLVAGL